MHTFSPLGGGGGVLVGDGGLGGVLEEDGGGRDFDGGFGDGGGGGDIITGVVLFTIDTSAQFQNSSGIEYSPHAGRFPLSPGGRHEFPVTHHHQNTQLGHS